MDRNEARFYLAAMIDGEGHVSCRVSKHGFWERAVLIANTDLALIDAIIECCDLLELDYGIHSRKRQNKNHKDCYMLKITGHDNLHRILDEVPIRSPSKVKTLALAVSTAERIHMSGRQRKIVDALLAEEVPTKDIAAQIGCDVRTIQYRKRKLAKEAR